VNILSRNSFMGSAGSRITQGSDAIGKANCPV
jgi:hypothetical protein